MLSRAGVRKSHPGCNSSCSRVPWMLCRPTAPHQSASARSAAVCRACCEYMSFYLAGAAERKQGGDSVGGGGWGCKPLGPSRVPPLNSC